MCTITLNLCFLILFYKCLSLKPETADEVSLVVFFVSFQFTFRLLTQKTISNIGRFHK